MKKLLFIALLFPFFCNAEVVTYPSCVNGTIWEVGDSLLQADLLEDGVNLYIYERSITLDATDFKTSRTEDGGFKMRALGKELVSQVEGIEEVITVNALLIISGDEKSMTIDLNIDGGETRTERLKCKPVTVDY